MPKRASDFNHLDVPAPKRSSVHASSQSTHLLHDLHSCRLLGCSELLALHLPEPRDGGAHRGGRWGGHEPGPPRDGLLARLRPALPDAGRDTLHRVLPAELAGVPRVLVDQDLLHQLPEGGAIASPVLPGDAHLLHALRHDARLCEGEKEKLQERTQRDVLTSAILVCTAGAFAYCLARTSKCSRTSR